MRDRKKKGIGLILIGIAIFAVPFFLRIREQNRTDQYLENFKEDEDESEETTGGKKKETILSGEGVIGIIEIPELDLKYPVFEGAGVTQLNEGIGHMTNTAGLCEEGNCVLAGHNGSRRGIYFTTILAKGVFVGFIIFFLSIAIRNVTISYHTMQTSQFFADKVSGYVTVPVNTSNASMQNLNENYKAFYSATVNRYNGILVDASNYEYNLINGRTPAEEFGQTSITVNRNYLDFNPIYGTDGKQISDTQLSVTDFNVLLPVSKEGGKENLFRQLTG